MTDITIPPEAVEAAADEIADIVNCHQCCARVRFSCAETPCECARRSLIALRAALKAWPGAREKYSDEHVALFNSDPALILPLPPESAKEGA